MTRIEFVEILKELISVDTKDKLVKETRDTESGFAVMLEDGTEFRIAVMGMVG